MRTPQVWILLSAGAAIWLIGTVYFAFRGPQVLETTPLRYWISFALTPILSALLCLGILQWMAIPHTQWAQAALLLAIPGMVGEAAVLTHMATWMPRLQMASGGRYAAMLFASYAVVLSLAEMVSLRTSLSR